jgi:threonine dehydrogenase-like Zn-dependent dehydrogenase
MLDIGICGTDKEICSFEYGTPPPGDDYLVIGHESLAEVVDLGTAVKRLAVPGTRTTATRATSANAASRKPTVTWPSTWSTMSST